MLCRVQSFRIVELAITKLARVTGSVAFLAAAPAMAAEMTVKAPWQPPVVQAYDWTGLYVGGHLGYAGGHSNWSAPPDLSSSLDLDQSSDIFDGSGSYFGGLQIGYDYMLANRVVLGVQLDSSFPGFPNLDGVSIGGISIFSTPALGLASYSESVLLSGTVRGRVDRPKRESGAICRSAASQIRSCLRNCRRRVLLQFATGLCASKLGKAEKDEDPRARRPAWTTSSSGVRGARRGGLPLW